MFLRHFCISCIFSCFPMLPFISSDLMQIPFLHIPTTILKLHEEKKRQVVWRFITVV